jgi:glycosyltransferase involved in cell wall biosynthesis
MKIFQLIQKPQYRGAEIFAAQLSQHLEAAGHEVFLISVFPGNDVLPFDGKKIQLNRPLSKRWFDIQGWKALNSLIKQHQPDIIQCNAGDTLKFAVCSKLLYNWKVPIVARNASMVSQYIKNPLIKTINRWLYKRVDAIISVSQHSKDDINEFFPVTKKKTSVITIGIELPKRDSVNWLNSNSNLNIIHVGGFTFEKNHRGLLRIFKLFLERQAEAHLHLLGEGPEREEIERLSKQLGLENNITFYGWVRNPMDYICKADMLLLPSIIEGLPGVILEAMACQTPVVAYNVGGVSEIVKHHETGFLIDKNDELSFVKAMEQASLSSVKQIIQNAYEMVVQNYNNQSIAQQFESTYAKIIHGKD